jgi:hypothetical protein
MLAQHVGRKQSPLDTAVLAWNRGDPLPSDQATLGSVTSVLRQLVETPPVTTADVAAAAPHEAPAFWLGALYSQRVDDWQLAAQCYVRAAPYVEFVLDEYPVAARDWEWLDNLAFLRHHKTIYQLAQEDGKSAVQKLLHRRAELAQQEAQLRSP